MRMFMIWEELGIGHMRGNSRECDITMDRVRLMIVKYLKKEKEKVILDLIIKDYNKANFYIALVFNSKIEKFKVLFIPIDVVSNSIEEYVCYQFINVNLVNYILEVLHNDKERYKDDTIRNKLNPNISSYYIEINTYIGKDSYTFKTTKYLPKEWVFFYEVLLILFEHVPRVMNELCCEILAVLDDRKDIILYQKSLEFNLFYGDIKKEFGCFELLSVEYLEKVNNLYFAIIDEELVIAQYDSGSTVLNLYCTNDDCSKYFYSFLWAVRTNVNKEFYKLMVVDDIKDFDKKHATIKYYLCYGVKNKCFKIIEGSDKGLLPITKYYDGLVKIVGKNKEKLEEIIKKG